VKAAFIDTNVYMHYKPIEEIPWPQLLDCDTVRVVVPRITVRELDSKKDSHTNQRVKDRIRRVLGQFEAWFPQGETGISRGVTITRYSKLLKFNLVEKDLDPVRNDDVLIATILQYREEHPEVEVVLITQDTGPRLTATDHGIDVYRLEEADYRIREDLDPQEKELRELKRQLQRYESASPKLRLGFAPYGDAHAVETIRPPQEMPALAVERKLTQLQAIVPEGRVTYHPLVPMAPSREQIERYNQQRKVFFAQCEVYMRNQWVHQNKRRRTIKLLLLALNDGTAPGDDLNLYLHFPDGFKLFDEETLPAAPEEPKPPREPKSLMDSSIPDADMSLLHAAIAPSREQPNAVTVSIQKTKSYDMHIKLKRVQHGVPEKLPELYVEFDSYESASSFGIDYEIRAANLLDPVPGRLGVIVEKEDAQ
jgi:rRNA-processing protein FCF1